VSMFLPSVGGSARSCHDHVFNAHPDFFPID
jgi:hypothetical protein